MPIQEHVSARKGYSEVKCIASPDRAIVMGVLPVIRLSEKYDVPEMATFVQQKYQSQECFLSTDLKVVNVFTVEQEQEHDAMVKFRDRR